MAAPVTQPFSPALSRQRDQQFGPRTLFGRPDKHLGRDYSCAIGTPLRAVGAGRVVSLGGSRTHVWGYFLHLDQGDGDIVEHHVLRDDPTKAPWNFRIGSRVELGQLIGYTGDTVKYDPHHHFGHQKNGVYLNPADLPWRPDALVAGSNAKPFDPAPSNESENDMYDNNAEARLFDRIGNAEFAAAPYRIFQWGTGLICYNPKNTRAWIIPTQAYVAVLVHLGLASAKVQPLPQEMYEFLNNFVSNYGDVLPTDSTVDKVLSLSDDDVEKFSTRISDKIGSPQIVLTAEQVKEITAAARDGAEDAVKSLSFVTTVAQ